MEYRLTPPREMQTTRQGGEGSRRASPTHEGTSDLGLQGGQASNEHSVGETVQIEGRVLQKLRGSQGMEMIRPKEDGGVVGGRQSS